ncbi:MAG: heterodisulfide reductase-related iron-sulfur binding cluster [Bacteroidetes bacterium]|nr:heterodisulfide reductase-related iron-sulfur binding cluster [Bacteroidota bacterium]MCL5025525.1 heterodisulfide reductase-related iron-sulfur binding cluster [Chloroflexota bacterium]
MAAQLTQVSHDIARLLQERTGENVHLCYLCRRCTSGCPVVEHMDLTPTQIMRSLQLGRDDVVLRSRTIWLCSHCEICYTRCPYALDIPSIMDELTRIAKERGIPPNLPEVPEFQEIALKWINRLGRMYELGIMAERNLRRGQPFRDMALAQKMMAAGKLRIVPPMAHYPKTLPPRAKAKPAGIAYFPGCSQHASAVELGTSITRVAGILGLDLVEPQGWKCCGSGLAHGLPPAESAAHPMRTMALIDNAGFEKMTTGCAACFSRFRRAVYAVQQDPQVKREVEAKTGYRYEGGVQVDHLLDTFYDDVGLDKVAAAVKRPLKGLKVACYYGCLLSRPPEITGFQHIDNPIKMDHLVQKIGIASLNWSYKTECCGASLMLTQTDIALEMTERILRNAEEVGADAIVVVCPFCHGNLDTRQEQISQRTGRRYDMPIIYLTQLMGVAFGLDPKELAMDKHFVSPLRLFEAK